MFDKSNNLIALKKDFRSILEIFIHDLKDYNTLYKKIIIFTLIDLYLLHFHLYDIPTNINKSYVLFMMFYSLLSILLSYISLKKPLSKFLAGTLKELGQIIFTGLGLLFMATAISIYNNFEFSKLIFIINIWNIIIVTKLFIAVCKYFEKDQL